ncbi:charged multivesicular body protein 4b, partial [Asbolus verrucosus]
MSFLDKVFGKKPAKTPTLSEAIQKLKLTEDVLTTKQNNLENKIKKEIAIARQNASTNKKAALQALQRKKRLERQLQQLDGAITTLEGQLEVLENANTNTLAVSSMKKASEALKATHKNMGVDQVDRILDDLAEQKDITDEIADAIGHPVGFDDGIDEDELERELEELGETLEEELSIDDL